MPIGLAPPVRGKFEGKLIGYDTDCVSTNGVDCAGPLVAQPVYGTYCCANDVEIPPRRTGGLIGYDTDIDPDTFQPTSKPVYASTQNLCIFPIAQLKRFTTRLLGYDTDNPGGGLQSRPVFGAGANSCTVVCGMVNCVLPLTLQATISSVQTAVGSGSGGCPPGQFPCPCIGDVSGAPITVTLTFNPTDNKWEGTFPNACGGCAASLPCGSPGGVPRCITFQTNPVCGSCFICLGFGSDPTNPHCSNCPPFPGNNCAPGPTVCSCDPIHFHFFIPVGCGSGPCGSCQWTIDVTP